MDALIEKALRVGNELNVPSVEMLDKKGKRKEDHRQTIINILFSGNLDVLYAISTVTPTVDGAATAMALVVLLQQQMLTEAFIKRLLLRKLKKESKLGKDGIINLLRDNSITSLILAAYTQIEGYNFTAASFKGVLKTVLDDPEIIEINPTKEENADKLKHNVGRLDSYCRTFIKLIDANRTLVSISFRRICYFIRVKVEEALLEEKLIDKKKPEQGLTTPLKVLASFVCLRYLIPIITSPEKYSLYDANQTINDTQRHNLVMVAKVLTNLCNGVSFGNKEPHMLPLNNFLEDQTPLFIRFLIYISDSPGSEALGTPQRFSFPIIEASVGHLMSYLQSALPRLEKEISGKTAPKEVMKMADKIDKLRVLVEKTLPKSSPSSMREKFKALTFKSASAKNWTVKSDKASRNSSDSVELEVDDDPSLPVPTSEPPASNPDTKKLGIKNSIELEDDPGLMAKLGRVNSGRRRGSILPGGGSSSSSEQLFVAQIAKKKAEKYAAPFRGSFGLYLLRSEKIYGKYQITDECIEFLGQFLSNIWELISLETLRIAYSAKSRNPTTSPITAATPPAPSDTPQYTSERDIDATIMEIAIERLVPVSTCHFSKVFDSSSTEQHKKIKFNRQDIQKDFSLLANGNPWTRSQMADLPNFEQVKFNINESAINRLTTLIEYVLNDVLQISSGALFASGRSAFLLTDIKNSIKTDTALKELSELLDRVKSKDSNPSAFVERRPSKTVGALALAEPRRGFQFNTPAPNANQTPSPNTNQTPLPKSPLSRTTPYTPNVNSVLHPTHEAIGITSEQEMSKRSSISVSRSDEDLAELSERKDSLTLFPTSNSRGGSPKISPQQSLGLDSGGSPRNGNISPSIVRSGSPNEPSTKETKRKSRIIRNNTSQGPFHYLY